MSFSFLPVTFQPPSGGGGGGGGGDLTAAQIKALYESNANTNAYTNADKGKLSELPTAEELISGFGGKVDKVAGSSLMTTEQAGKLADLPTAEELISALGGKVDKVAGSTLMTTAQATKLAGIAAEATKNATDAQLRNRATHTGEQPISSVTGLQGALGGKVDKVAGSNLMTSAQAEKLAGIDTGATKNATDAQLRDRATHTGKQPISSVTGLQTALDSKVDKVAGSTLMTTAQATKLAGIAAEATKNATDAQLRDRATHTGEQPISSVTGLQGALAERVTVSDEKLTNAREWTAATVEQAEAEARTATTRRAWTAQRVGQAIAAWWAATGTAFGRAVVSWADAAAGRTALGLGTAATKAAQTGATDTTAGALMGVGAFGWGVTTPVAQVAASCLQAMASSALTLPGNAESGACLRMFSRPGAFTGLWTCADGAFSGRAWLLYTNDSWASQSVTEVFTSRQSSVISAKTALGVNKLESRTKATLPMAAANSGMMYLCTDAAGGAAPVISNGTAWLAIQTTPLA